MRLLDLNKDVLAEIVSYLSTLQALNFMLAARSLRSIAERHVLSVVRIRTKGSDRVVKFCTHMLAEGGYRLAYLRSLTILSTGSRKLRRYVGEHLQVGAGLLASLLERAHALRHLMLDDVEGLLEIEPRIGAAIAAHPGFCQLQLDGLGQRSMEMLYVLRSQPRKVEVSPAGYFANLDAAISCMTSLQQMDTLILRRILSRSETLTATGEDAQCTWPTVHQLELDTVSKALPAIIHAFPNVRIFTVEAMTQSSADPLGIFWPSLDYLGGHSEELAKLSISCPVYFLYLASTMRCFESYEPDALLVIRNVSPVVLAIPVEVIKPLDTFWTELVHNAPRLRAIYIGLSGDTGDQGLESVLATWMDMVPAILAASTGLVYLELYLYPDRYMSDAPTASSFAQRLSDLGPSRHTFEKYARMLVERIPSLRHLAVGYGHGKIDFHYSPGKPPFKGKFWWWRAKDMDGGRTLEIMEPAVGKQIRARLNTPRAGGVVECQ